MRRATGIIALMLALVSVPAAAEAVGDPVPRSVSPAMADRDRDGISDDLQARLADADRGDRFDVIAMFNRSVSPDAVQRGVGAFRVERTFTIIDGFAATMTAAQIEALARRADVARIQGRSTAHALLNAAREDYGVELARTTWDVDGSSGGGASGTDPVGICIIDTGVWPGHYELDTPGKIAGWIDYVGGASSPYDDHYHGTHVAAIAAGDGTGSADAATFRGVAPAARIWAAKVLDANGSGSDLDVISGIQWCASQSGVDVISMSLGISGNSDGSDAVSEASNNAAAAGKVVVVAAGNEGDVDHTIGSPAAAAGVIAVGAAADTSDGGRFLAPFSSRGPTADNRVKPDVVAPGVDVISAFISGQDDFIALSGTSMATPYVAGVIALGLQLDPGMGPAAARSRLEGTAHDWGADGKDNEFGAGLVDAQAFVGLASGDATYPALPFPQDRHATGTVPRNGQWTYTFEVTATDAPVTATLLIDGTLKCSFFYWGFCWGYEWSPDIDLELLDPNGNQVALSECPLQFFCAVGRQETLTFWPTQTGMYTLRAYPFTGSPNNGKGASVALDVSFGPLSGSAPPPPDGNDPPLADAGPDQTVTDADGTGAEDVVLDGTASSDPDGDELALIWSEGGVEIATGATPTVTLVVGTHVIMLTVGDPDGAADTDDVVVVVEPAPAPASTMHVGDLDGSSSAGSKFWDASVTITVLDASENPVGGVTVSGSWSFGGNASCVTDTSGSCTVTKGGINQKKLSITLTITGLNGSLVYDAASNHDPDGDSDGTAITVTQ